MSRIARAVAEGLPHYVTQHGNYRQVIFRADADYQQYEEQEDTTLIHQIRCSLIGRPCGDGGFTENLERTFGRWLEALIFGRQRSRGEIGTVLFFLLLVLRYARNTAVPFIQ